MDDPICAGGNNRMIENYCQECCDKGNRQVFKILFVFAEVNNRIERIISEHGSFLFNTGHCQAGVSLLTQLEQIKESIVY